MPGMNARDTALANMYQRLPGSALSTVRKLKPMNYAALEVPEFAPLGDALAVYGSTRGDVHSRWKTYTLPVDATLSDALAAVERTNAQTKRARKFKLTFCNGVHMDLVRSDPEDPTTLTYGSLFDPSGAFRVETDPLVQSRRPANEAALVATAGSNGHLHQRDRSVSSLHPSVLYRNAPQPTAGKMGFTFTPVSPALFQPRPNEIIPGVRPSIRNVNPDAYYYRPRAVPLERAEASLQQTRDVGAHPHATVYPSEPVDHRFRLVTSLPAQASFTASRGPRHAAKFQASMGGPAAAASSYSAHYEPPAADASLPPIHH